MTVRLMISSGRAGQKGRARGMSSCGRDHCHVDVETGMFAGAEMRQVPVCGGRMNA